MQSSNKLYSTYSNHFIFQTFTQPQSTLEEESRHKASLQYMQSHNRGGLTNVSDDFYEYTLALETSCKSHFTINAFQKHRWNACKVAREQVRKDSHVISSFNKLMASTPRTENGDSVDVKGAIQARLMKRYLNMRCKEYVKVIKREMSYEKQKEHRKKVQEKSKAANSKNALNVPQMLNDTSDKKNVSFYTLKAMSAMGKDAFKNMKKSEIHFLYHLFGLKFKKSKTKAILSEELVSKVINAQEMTHPNMCTLDSLNSLKNDTMCTTCTGIREVLQTLPNNENVNSTNADTLEVQAVKPRRKQFRPTNIQKEMLQADNEKGLTQEVIKKRALEFGVHVTQIKSWHRRFQLKQQPR